MSTMASQITSLTFIHSTVYSDADQRKHQSSVSLAFVRGIHRWPMNSLHKGLVTRKCSHLMTSSYEVFFVSVVCLIYILHCQRHIICYVALYIISCNINRVVKTFSCIVYNSVMTTGIRSSNGLQNFPWEGWENTWWRHQMETFSALLAFCAGNSPVTVEFPAQR